MPILKKKNFRLFSLFTKYKAKLAPPTNFHSYWPGLRSHSPSNTTQINRNFSQTIVKPPLHAATRQFRLVCFLFVAEHSLLSIPKNDKAKNSNMYTLAWLCWEQTINGKPKTTTNTHFKNKRKKSALIVVLNWKVKINLLVENRMRLTKRALRDDLRHAGLK